MQRADPALLRAHGEQRLDRPFSDVLDRGQAEADALLALDGEVQLAFVDVRRQHGDAAVAALTQVHRELVGVLRLDGEKGRGKMPRIVRLEVRGAICEQRVCRGVRLVEAVAGEVFDLLEEFHRLLLADALRLGPLEEGFALLGHDLGIFLSHGLPQHVRLPHREAGHRLR